MDEPWQVGVSNLVTREIRIWCSTKHAKKLCFILFLLKHMEYLPMMVTNHGNELYIYIYIMEMKIAINMIQPH